MWTFIWCYAIPNDSNGDEKDQYYERLLTIVEKCHGKILTIMMEDLNLMVGIDNTGYEDITWRHGLTGKKEREWWQICRSMCLQQNGYGWRHFTPKHIHEATWVSLNHIAVNQIDHICIKKSSKGRWIDIYI